MTSAATTPSGSYQLQKLHVSSSWTSYSSVCYASSSICVPIARSRYCKTTRTSLYHSRTTCRRTNRPSGSITMMDFNALNDLSPQVTIPSGSPFPEWSNWMLLTALPMVLPIFKGKWGRPLIMMKRRLATTLATLETMSQVIEQVAVKVDETADKMVENLPEGSRLRNAFEMIDDLAEETVKAADCVQDLLQKVEDFEDCVEKAMDLEEQSANEQVAGPDILKLRDE